MQRDMDLIRELLIKMADHEHGFAPKIEFPARSDEEIGFHIWLMSDAKLIKAVEITSVNSPSPQAAPSHLTWQGYEFLEAAKSPKAWERAKQLLLSKAGGLSFEVLKAYLIYEAKHSLGIG